VVTKIDELAKKLVKAVAKLKARDVARRVHSPVSIEQKRA
jgi:hypothetical protein